MRSDGQCTHVFTVHSTHVFTPGTQFQQLVYNYFLETVLSIKTFNIHLGAINSVSKSPWKRYMSNPLSACRHAACPAREAIDLGPPRFWSPVALHQASR